MSITRGAAEIVSDATLAEREAAVDHLRGKISAIAGHRGRGRLSEDEARLLTDCLGAAADELIQGMHR